LCCNLQGCYRACCLCRLRDVLPPALSCLLSSLCALLPVGRAMAGSCGSARRTTWEGVATGRVRAQRVPGRVGYTGTSHRHCALIPSLRASMSFINRYVAFLPAACTIGAAITEGSAAVLRPLLVGSDPARVAPSLSKLASSAIAFVRSTPSPASSPFPALEHVEVEPKPPLQRAATNDGRGSTRLRRQENLGE